MASSLSANRGSLLTLKFVTRCGFRPCERQMRPTVESDTPTSRAIELRDQCVALAGLLWVVFSITWATTFAEIDAGIHLLAGLVLDSPP